jgi:hypothetical protein
MEKTELPESPRRLKPGVIAGLKKGWQAFRWLIQIVVPISLATTLLEYSGLFQKMESVLGPVMGLLHLPASAVLPLLAGMLTGIYSGIAAMVALPLSRAEMTLIAVFLLISHNLIQEGVIQGKAGLHPLKATAFRLCASVLTVAVMARLMDFGQRTAVEAAGLPAASEALTAVLARWALSMLTVSGKILFIIMILMVALELMKRYNMVDCLVDALAPVLKGMGLNRRVGFLWLTAAVFGVSYGAAVIVEEAREGQFSREELEKLHLSIGINHSIVEDPAVFLTLGLPAFWLWVPRFLVAVLAVHLMALWQKARNSRTPHVPEIRH